MVFIGSCVVCFIGDKAVRQIIYTRIPSVKYFYSLLLILFVVPLAADSLANKSDLMANGARLSMIADQLEQAAKNTIKRANDERKKVIDLRQQLKNDASNEALLLELKNTTAAAKSLQLSAPLIRKQSEQVRNTALREMQQGLRQRYHDWIVNPGPIQLSTSASKTHSGTMAHNTRIMSASPSMKSMQPKAEVSRAEDMSLELSSSMSQDLPASIDTTSFAISRERAYFAHIEVEGEENGVILNQIQSWRLVLTEIDGRPVRDAVISFNGHMPGHVHGLPTQPLLSKELAPGVYRLSGVKFQMAGWWVIELEIEVSSTDSTSTVKDAVRFNLSL